MIKKILLLLTIFLTCTTAHAERWDGWHYAGVEDITNSLDSGYTYICTSYYKPKFTTARGFRTQYIDGDRIDKWRIYIANEPTSSLKLKIKILEMNQAVDDDADYYECVAEGGLHEGLSQGWNTLVESSPLECSKGDVIALYVEGESVTCAWSDYQQTMTRMSGELTVSGTQPITNIEGSNPSPAKWNDYGFAIQFHTYNTTDSVPSISSVTDNTTYLTISGVNFGTKSQAAPKMWDDMEMGSFDSDWTWQFGQISDSPPYVTVSSDLSRTGAGDYVLKGDWYQAAVNGRGETHIGPQEYSGIANGDKWYIFYHFYHDFDRWGTTADDGDFDSTLSQDCTIGTNVLYLADAGDYNNSDTLVIDDGETVDQFSYTGKDGNNLTGVTGIENVFSIGATVREDSWAGNWKTNRTWTSPGNPNCYYASGTSGQTSRTLEFQTDSNVVHYFGNQHDTYQKIGEWHNIETFYDLDDTADDLTIVNVNASASGFMELNIDGHVLDRGHFLMNDNTSHKLTDIGFHCPRTRLTQGVKDGYVTYLDDIYVDDTPQRVMLTNNADYWQSTIKEIAIPIAWSDNSITVSYAPKSLEGQDIYIHVFNDDNIVTNSGYSLSDSSQSQSSSQTIAGIGNITGTGRIYHN